MGAALSTACLATKAPELLMLGRLLFGINNGKAMVFLHDITCLSKVDV